jgi:signal transduction histidine kinase
VASAAAVTHALDVLIDNSLKHGRGEVTVSAEQVGTGVVLKVADEGTTGIVDAAPTGAGRPPPGGDVNPAAPTGERHGIGLALARALIEADGGRLQLPEWGAPSVFSIVLRRSPAI